LGFETGYKTIEIGKITSNKPRHQSYWAIFKQRLTTSKTNPSETRCLWLSALLWRSCCILLPPARYQSYGFVLRCWHTRRLAAVLSITRTPEINGTLYAFFGMEDASIPPEQVDQIEAELKKYLPSIVFSLPWSRPVFLRSSR